MKTVTIIGSHGYNGKYGGWDQLVNNLVDSKDVHHKLKIVSPKENEVNSICNETVEILRLPLSGFGLFGLVSDYLSTIALAKSSHSFLLLGAKGIPTAIFSKLLFNVKLVVNVGGIEWERPQYSFLVRKYLWWCFQLSCRYADVVILDNEFYTNFVPYTARDNTRIIPYGGTIDFSLNIDDIIHKYPFLSENYYLSISRSISDNQLIEICEQFIKMPERQLVLIANFSKTAYGREVLERFKNTLNIILIDGVYNKPELDIIRRNCRAYIHTHTLCGSAPSLIEMIVCGKPIFSIDVPQNRFTLKGEGTFFTDFDQLNEILKVQGIKPSERLQSRYQWLNIVRQYEDLLISD